MPSRKPDRLDALLSKLEAKEAHPSPFFSWGSIVNLGGVPLITAILIVAGSWAVNQNTTARNEAEIKSEKDQREKLRENFLSTQNQLIQVLGKIDTRLSVTEKQQEIANRQLEKLSDIISATKRR